MENAAFVQTIRRPPKVTGGGAAIVLFTEDMAVKGLELKIPKDTGTRGKKRTITRLLDSLHPSGAKVQMVHWVTQINYMPDKSDVIIIIINSQGQMHK